MSNYLTGNPVPSDDPRDLDDNATRLDSFVNGSASTYTDRLGVARMSIAGMRALVNSFTSANVAALSGLVGNANLGIMFTGPGAMATYALTAFGRTLAGAADNAAARVSLGLSALATATIAAIANGGTGAADAATARSNLGLGTVSTLNTVGLTQGGTGATTAAGARTNLGLGTAAIATIGTSGNNVPLLNTANTWSAAQAILGATPVTDGGSNLGTASLRWATVFAQTGTINTSDAREKTELRGFDSAELKVAVALSRGIQLYQWLEAVGQKGDTARLHVGLTVQKAIALFKANGLDPFAYGVICHDAWDEVPAVYEVTDAIEEVVETIPAQEATFDYSDEDKPKRVTKAVREKKIVHQEACDATKTLIREAIPAGDRYGFRYDELNLWIAAGISARLDALERAE